MNALVVFSMLVAAVAAVPVKEIALSAPGFYSAYPYAGYPVVFDAAKEEKVELKAFAQYAQLPFAQYAQLPVTAPVAVAAPIETRVHYAETPVVTGYQTNILKPAIGQAIAAPVFAPAAVKVSSEEVQALPVAPFATPFAAPIAAPLAYSSPLAYSNVNLDVPAPVPAGDAPAWEELFSQEKVLAPARAVSKITPQITNVVPEAKIEKVSIDVPIAKPFAHPVPVAVPTPVAQPYAHPVPVPVATHYAAPIAALPYALPFATKADC